MRKLSSAVVLTLILLVSALPAEAQRGYGSSVAVGDGDVFVGEPSNRQASGFVYVYREGVDGWAEVLQLSRSDATDGDGFGSAIAIAGDTLLVGAREVSGGSVYVFEKEGDGWAETGSFAPEGLATDAGFGSTLAVSGDLALVGAPGADGGAGAAYLFRRDGGSWTQIGRLVATEVEEPRGGGGRRGPQPDAGAEAGEEGEEDEPQPARFGSTVAVHGDWAWVGAPAVGRRSGAVYVFRRDGDSWNQVAQLPGRGGQQGAAFGSALTFRNEELYVGAPGANSRAGGIRFYGWDDESEEWSQTASLAAFDGRPGSAFGSSIAFDGNDLLVGAPGAGRVYRFARDDEGNFVSSTKLGTEDVSNRDRFASSLAAAGDVLVAGLPGDDYGAGTAVIMSRTDWGWARTKVLSDVKGFEPIRGEAVPCVDGKVAQFGCDSVELLSFLPVSAMGAARGVSTNDIWGWTDGETGREYAIVGMTDQAAFVDVTDPLDPVYVGRLPKTEGSPGSVWRDIKVYKDHAFIVSDAAREHGVQVFDLTRLREFEGDPIDFTEDARYDGIHSAHNIVINTATGFAYAVGASGGGETCGGGLHMINIEDPKHPAFAGCFSDPSTGRRGTGYSHDAQCVTYQGPDEAFQGKEICFGANETALSIADVSDKRNPVALAMATYPNVSYTHQGWLSEDHRYFYMNDELDEIQDRVAGTRTLIWDVQELDDPILVAEYVSDNQATDHNLYILGSYMFQSNYDSGLRVFDVSDPENPEPVAYLDTVPYGEDGGGMSGSWSNYPYFSSGAVAVTSGQEGLFLVRVRPRE